MFFKVFQIKYTKSNLFYSREDNDTVSLKILFPTYFYTITFRVLNNFDCLERKICQEKDVFKKIYTTLI